MDEEDLSDECQNTMANILQSLSVPKNMIRSSRRSELAHQQLESRSGAGNDFLGWLDLPVNYDKEEFARIKEAAKKIREDSDVLLVAGIAALTWAHALLSKQSRVCITTIPRTA